MKRLLYSMLLILFIISGKIISFADEEAPPPEAPILIDETETSPPTFTSLPPPTETQTSFPTETETLPPTLTPLPLPTETETSLPTLTPLSLPTETETPTSDLITICHPQQIVHYAIGAGEIDEDYQNPESVLGEIDPEKYLALGLSGEITLSFAPYTILNQTNQDFSLHIGNLGQVDVFVSPDGITWYQLVTISETFDFDLAGLSWIQYIRVQDVSHEDDFDADDVIGTILEGITAFACTLTPQIPQILPTLTPTSTPTFDGNHISEPSATLSSTETIIPEQTSTPPFPPTFIPDLPTIEPTIDPILTNYPPFERLGICFVSHLGENFTEWRITNPNPVPLSISPLIELKYEFYAFDEAGEVVQEALDWDNLNPITPFAQSIWLRWYLEINGQPTEILDFEYIEAHPWNHCDQETNVDLPNLTQDVSAEVCDVDCFNTFNQAFTTTSNGWEVEYDFRSSAYNWEWTTSLATGRYEGGLGFYVVTGRAGVLGRLNSLIPDLNGMPLNINFVEIEYTISGIAGVRRIHLGMATSPTSGNLINLGTPPQGSNIILSSGANLNGTPNRLQIYFQGSGAGHIIIHRVRFAGGGQSPVLPTPTQTPTVTPTASFCPAPDGNGFSTFSSVEECVIPTPTPTLTPTPTPEIVCVVTIKIDSENPILGYATPLDVIRENNENSVIDISGRNDVGIIERWRSGNDIVRATVHSVEFWFYSGGGNVIDVIDGDCDQLPIAEPPPFEEYNIVLSDSWTPEERADIEAAVRNIGEALYVLPNSTDTDGNPLFTNPFESPVEAFNQVMTAGNSPQYIYFYRVNDQSGNVTIVYPPELMKPDYLIVGGVNFGGCKTENANGLPRTIVCNWDTRDSVYYSRYPEHAFVHELGHVFVNRTGGYIPGQNSFYGRIDVPIDLDVVDPNNSNHPNIGAIYDDTGQQVVMGAYIDDFNNDDWVRGIRGWGSWAAPLSNITAFQQNPYSIPDASATQRQREIERDEAAADMFLNWVYSTVKQGGFQDINWRDSICHRSINELPSSCQDVTRPGLNRLKWMNTTMRDLIVGMIP